MTKGLEVLESLDKLEECAYAMKDLPMSNWIDLAENEAELDLKITDWVETIKLELFKGKQDLDRLEELEKENQELKEENQELIKKSDCCLWKECNKISQENAKLKNAIEIIKKHFIIKLEEETDLNGNVWGRLVSIQSKEDEGTWDTTACANIVNCKEDFDLLKEVLEE